MGRTGALLPDLQAKLSTYLGYALDGQLLADYPQLSGKPIIFQLSFAHEPGAREREFVDIIRRRYLDPDRIVWREAPIKGP